MRGQRTDKGDGPTLIRLVVSLLLAAGAGAVGTQRCPGCSGPGWHAQIQDTGYSRESCEDKTRSCWGDELILRLCRGLW